MDHVGWFRENIWQTKARTTPFHLTRISTFWNLVFFVASTWSIGICRKFKWYFANCGFWNCCPFSVKMADVDPDTLLEWLSMGQGDERDMQLIALEQLCMLLLMSDNIDRCFERWVGFNLTFLVKSIFYLISSHRVFLILLFSCWQKCLEVNEL